MGKESTYKLNTRCMHLAGEMNPYGAITTPIFQTATFSHPKVGDTTGFNYTRADNPTRKVLEDVITSLEGAKDTVATTSGMAAITLALQLFGRGDHIIASEDLYGGSVRLFENVGGARGTTFSYINTGDLKAVEQEIRTNTKALFVETPSNPVMEITDLEEISRIAKKHGLLLIVDNTLMSPYFQNPIAWGADIVVHSGTKFLCGHNDTLAGFISTSSEELAGRIRFLSMTTGGTLSPFDSFLLLRGIKTLGVRQERQQQNAFAAAEFLQKHPKVKKVYYVGLPEHPGYAIQKKQARGFGSMISFKTDSEATARQVLERVKLIAFAESLGGVESLITYPMLQTHSEVPKERRDALGITEDFLRISIGIEDAEDLVEDLAQALE